MNSFQAVENDIRTERLTARVRAVNRANKRALELYAELAPIFSQFVGQQIIATTGSLLQRVAKKVPEFPRESGLQIYRDAQSRYRLCYVVKVSENYDHRNGGCTCVYHETSVSIGTLANNGEFLAPHNFLGELYPAPEPEFFRTDYTVEEIQAGRKKVEEAKELLRVAERALGDFESPDR